MTARVEFNLSTAGSSVKLDVCDNSAKGRTATLLLLLMTMVTQIKFSSHQFATQTCRSFILANNFHRLSGYPNITTENLLSCLRGRCFDNRPGNSTTLPPSGKSHKVISVR